MGRKPMSFYRPDMEEMTPGQFREVYGAHPEELERPFYRSEERNAGHVYTIQHRYGGEGEWTFSNYDNIAIAARKMPGYLFHPSSTRCPVHHGFANLHEGIEALRAVREDNAGLPHVFRLVSIEYTCLMRSFDV
jgi:hypothetical protein